MAKHGGGRRDSRKPSRGDVVFGRLPVYELLRAGRREVHRLLRVPGRGSPETDDTVALAARRNIAVIETERAQLDRLTGGGHHQGIAAEVGAYAYVDFESLVAVNGPEPPLWLLLDHIQDPQNLGALLRTAETAGVTAVVIPQDRAVGVTEAVVRASAGAAEHVNVCRVVNLARCMRALKEAGVWLWGLEALPEAVPWCEAALAGPCGLVVGSEGAGLGRLVRETCDGLIRLPARGRVTSLNAGVSAAIALYEVLRQRAVR